MLLANARLKRNYARRI